MVKKEFLRANWFRMVSANYSIDPSLLLEHLPYGTALEDHQGKYYVSLVAFRYCQTRLYKVRVPFHTRFEEINLRFYVKREISPGQWRSELAFTKLYFPKLALTLVAKYIYKENYETTPMRHQWDEDDKHLITSYGLKKKGWHDIELKTTKKPELVLPHTDEYFFSKHLWGTSQMNPNSCTLYEVTHPEWKSYVVQDAHISFNFGRLFGQGFEELNHRQPESVHLFDGSEVVIYQKQILKR